MPSFTPPSLFLLSSFSLPLLFTFSLSIHLLFTHPLSSPCLNYSPSQQSLSTTPHYLSHLSCASSLAQTSPPPPRYASVSTPSPTFFLGKRSCWV
jgi:hypothetical protein